MGRHGKHFRMRFGGHQGGFGIEWGDENRTRRGDIKFLILEVLAERPRHGYDVMSELEARHGNRPSAGSVYPTLQMLEDGGFVTSEQRDGKRVFTITDEGRALLAEREQTKHEEHETRGDFREAAREAKEALVKFGEAVYQAARLREPDVWRRVIDVVDRARKEIYQILAER